MNKPGHPLLIVYRTQKNSDYKTLKAKSSLTQKINLDNGRRIYH